MLLNSQKSLIDVSRKVARWFQISVEIRLFGKVIWSYVWPPDYSSNFEPLIEEEPLL